MIVDTSALVCVLLREPEREDMLNVMSHAPRRAIGAPNWLEVCMVIDCRDNLHARMQVDVLLRKLEIEVLPFDEVLVSIARAAFREYGRGSEHSAELNYGDCMAYALARYTGEPLLFKGNDFTHTDITPALH